MDWIELDLWVLGPVRFFPSDRKDGKIIHDTVSKGTLEAPE